MDTGLKTNIEQTFKFRLNRNQYKDLARLIFEIRRRDGTPENNILAFVKQNRQIAKAGGRNKFYAIKQSLIEMRFPLTSKNEKIDTKNVFLADLKKPLKKIPQPARDFRPEKIFIEKSARNSYLAKKFKRQFPETEVEELKFYWEYLRKNKFAFVDLKKPLVFIVKEQWDFIKACPCTKYHLGCNYWILNLGFGCPYDCSYCFLQQYSNFPGIVLPANLDDFFDKFNNFYKKIKSPIRIGTGEFCDSLALDHITGYAKQLIDFFKQKSVYFELKTKSNNIENLLKTKPSANIVISWSLNPQAIIDAEELGSAALEERLTAARKVQDAGFSLSFHFDPIIYSENWQQLYKEVIDKLYAELKPSFKWISLGTLRGTRKLKNVAEQRFPKSNIFYGELFLGKDKKLRYPNFLRSQVYKNMVKWIRDYDKKTPIYLCMEDKNLWQIIDKKFSSADKIEKYLLSEKY